MEVHEQLTVHKQQNFEYQATFSPIPLGKNLANGLLGQEPSRATARPCRTWTDLVGSRGVLRVKVRVWDYGYRGDRGWRAGSEGESIV
jgi:hypothetical protein